MDAANNAKKKARVKNSLVIYKKKDSDTNVDISCAMVYTGEYTAVYAG